MRGWARSAAPAGLDWITALRDPQVKALVRDGDLQLSLSGQADLAEITSPDFPGERLVAGKNPFLEAERARKRDSLLVHQVCQELTQRPDPQPCRRCSTTSTAADPEFG